MGQSSGQTTVFLRHFVLVILCGWLTGMQGGMKLQFHSTLHTSQSSAQNNKHKVSQKQSCLPWWSVHSSQKHVETDKYTKNKLYTKLVLFTRNVKHLRVNKYWQFYSSVRTVTSYKMYGQKQETDTYIQHKTSLQWEMITSELYLKNISRVFKCCT
jgi:hypothetical protein